MTKKHRQDLASVRVCAPLNLHSSSFFDWHQSINCIWRAFLRPNFQTYVIAGCEEQGNLKRTSEHIWYVTSHDEPIRNLSLTHVSQRLIPSRSVTTSMTIGTFEYEVKTRNNVARKFAVRRTAEARSWQKEKGYSYSQQQQQNNNSIAQCTWKMQHPSSRRHLRW